MSETRVYTVENVRQLVIVLENVLLWAHGKPGSKSVSCCAWRKFTSIMWKH